MGMKMDEEIKRWTARRKGRQLQDFQEAYSEAMLELRARKSCRPCVTCKASDPSHPAGLGC